MRSRPAGWCRRSPRFRSPSSIVVTGALYFADRRMKTADNYFRGFPAVWNAPVFYLFLLRPDPWIAAAAIVLLAVLTFVPVPFLHPFRVRRLRVFNALLIVAWAAPCGVRAGPRYVAGALGDRRAVRHRPLFPRSPACCGARKRSDMFELLYDPNAWAALVTLTALEIILGIDNIVFISVLVSRCSPEDAKRARQIGLALALVFRIILLFGLTWLMKLTIR